MIHASSALPSVQPPLLDRHRPVVAGDRVAVAPAVVGALGGGTLMVPAQPLAFEVAVRHPVRGPGMGEPSR